MKKWLLIAVIIAVLAGGWMASNQARLNHAPRISYRTAPVEKGDLTQSISVNGTLNPLHMVTVGTQVSGTIYKIHADFNQKVAEGEVLAEIEPSLLVSQLEQSKASQAAARAKLSLSEKTYSRTKALLEKDYVARQDLDTAEQDLQNSHAQMVQATAQVKRDEVGLENATIRSPISGVVISRSVDVGQTVAASYQTPELFKIAQDLKKMQINAVVSEADIGNIKPGQHVTFTVDAFPDRVFSGAITQVRLNSDNKQNVVTYTVLVNVDNADETLLPGMTALATIQIALEKDVLKVPTAALRFKPPEPVAGVSTLPKSKRYIYLWDGQNMRPVIVSIGASDGRFTKIISSEVNPGDKVILEATIPE